MTKELEEENAVLKAKLDMAKRRASLAFDYGRKNKEMEIKHRALNQPQFVEQVAYVTGVTQGLESHSEYLIRILEQIALLRAQARAAEIAEGDQLRAEAADDGQ